MSHLVIPLIGAASVLAAACAIPASSERSAAPAPCGVEISERHGMVTVRAVVESDTPLSGAYALDLTRKTAGGTVEMTQGGAFVASAGQRTVLNEAVLSGRARDIDARLTLRTDRGVLTCPGSAQDALETEI